MYNVLLVEDDSLEREIMRSSWVWQKSDFCLAAEVSSGEDAWAVLSQGNIDIVLTDIKMPGMDGLELSKRIHEEMPNIKIIIYSGHSDFQYARQAVSLGVSEYLVKTVKSEELLDALQKVAVKLREEARIYEEVSNYREQLQNNRQHQRQMLLENLAAGILSGDQLKQQAELLGLAPDCQFVCCAIVMYLDDKILINESEHLMILESQQVIDAFFKDLDVISFVHNLRENYLIFRNPQLSSIKEILRHAHICVAGQQQRSNRLYRPMIALGGLKEGIAGIPESFADARFLLNFHHLIGSDDLLFFDEVQPIHQTTYKSELALAKEKESINRILAQGNKSDVPDLVDSLVDKLQNINISLVFFQYTYIEIANIIRHFLLEIGENPDDIRVGQAGSQNFLLSGNYLNWANDLPSFGQYLEKTLHAVIDIRNRKKRFQFNDVVLKAKKYIDQNFHDPTLNLTSIAAVVNINPSYFSALFSQEMGDTFIEYLTGIRIEKAKVLLKTTSLRTSDIAFAVGFSDSNYFSSIFRKITSESPRSFKSKIDRTGPAGKQAFSQARNEGHSGC